jgi:hypothetical protein
MLEQVALETLALEVVVERLLLVSQERQQRQAVPTA